MSQKLEEFIVDECSALAEGFHSINHRYIPEIDTHFGGPVMFFWVYTTE